MKNQEEPSFVQPSNAYSLEVLANIAAQFVKAQLTASPSRSPGFRSAVMLARGLLDECSKQMEDRRRMLELVQQAQPHLDALAALRMTELAELRGKHKQGVPWPKVLLYITGKF